MQRLNRILLIGGAGLAGGAVLLALLTRPFNPQLLGVNLLAIGLGLLMGKGIGMFMFRRVLPTASHK
jgi:nucleoside-diphosphate-sugar epimerase